jgi:hypothetical protein
LLDVRHKWAAIGLLLFACSSSKGFAPEPFDASAEDSGGADVSLGFPDALPDAPEDAGPNFRYVFLSSVTFPGDFGGAAGADALCQSLAKAAGLPGTYMAWVATDQSSPSKGFVKSQVGYELTNGLPVAESYAFLIGQQLVHPINVDEHAHVYDGTCDDAGFEPCGWTAVWTGARANGTWDEAGAGGSCFGFTVADAGATGHVGSYLATDTTWTSGSGATPPACASELPVYCFEQ